MREDSKIYAIFLTPTHPEQMKCKKKPPLAATEAVLAAELINVWGINLNELPRGAETTAHRNVFRIGLEDEDTALCIRLMYAEKTERSIMIPYRDKSGAETPVAFICTKELTPSEGFREATITIETFASGECEILKTNINKSALERINLEVKGDIYTSSQTCEARLPT